MIRRVLKQGHHILYKRAEEVVLPVERKVCRQIIRDLIDTMLDCFDERQLNSEKGVGIAAPQISTPKRVFCVRCPSENIKVFINPRIEFMSADTDIQYEGCLCLFGYRGKVRRPLEITMSFLNEQFREVTCAFKNQRARLLQHEYDHLEGILYTDRMEPNTKLITYEEYIVASEMEWVYPNEK